MSSSPSITPPPWSPRGASARPGALGTVALLFALTLAGCGEDKVVVRNLFLEISSEAPASGRLESLRILFQKGDARYPSDVAEAAFNPALGALDPVARPVLLSVSYDGATFGDGRDVTVLVIGRSGTTPVTRFEGHMDLDTEQVVKVHMKALPGGCDDDRDGFLDCTVSGCCEGGSVFGDCVGANAAANPWAIEASCEPCADEIDQDCQGGDQPCVDTDGDRIADCAEETCGKNDPRSGPGLPEICDTKDNDCDGQSDEGLSFRYRGQTLDKGDACGQGACAGGTVECADDGGLRCSTDDRAVTEICGNTIDDDCDGRVDEGCQVGDFDGDGFLVAEDCNDFDAGAYPGRTGEPCCPLAAQGNAAAQRACDVNCDGNVSFCEDGDADGDGVTVAEGDCNDGDAMVAPGKPEKCGDAIDQDCSAGDLSCTGLVDADGDGWSASVDCADADGAVRPDAVEICNGLDDDCDGAVDEGDPGGGGQCGETDVGACSFGFEHCQNSAGVFGQVACVGSIEPEAGDVCDGRDEDCDGETDEGFTWEGLAIGQACDGVGACGVGVVECAGGRTDRATCSTNPDGAASGATTEVCDAVDNDCDGETNEGLDDVVDSTCSKLGVCAANLDKIVATCTLEGAWECDYAAVPGYQAGAEVTCDGLDNDCDGAFDEDLTFTEPGGAVRPFGAGCDGADADLCQNGVVACDPANNRRTVCSETGAARVELCDGADNDCDGETDEDFRDTTANRVKLTGALFADDNGAFLGDACGAGACGAGVVVCGTTETLKCSTDPRSAAIPNPPADVCDGLDNDCDGVADENFIAGGTVKLQNALATADNGKVLGAACGAGECGGGTVVCKTPEALGCSSDADAYTTNFAGQTVLKEDTCNGKDDNCNGTTDDAFVATSGANRKPLAGALYASDNGKIKGASCGIGECLKNPATGASSPGVVQCSADGSKLECSSDTRATTETCDNLDNDCDGTDDDPFRSATDKPLSGALFASDNGKTKDAACGTGACASGRVVCSADKTKLVCNSDNRSSNDVCDAVDNDCDGSKDEGYLYEGLAIGATCDGVGGCGIGVVACAVGVNDRATCSTNPDGTTSQAGTETCDGQDNDCDLQIDEDFTYNGQPVGGACDGVGECGAGTVQCLPTGAAGCSTDPGGSAHVSTPETCDNKDNDCNGQTDDGIAATPTSCGVGACAATGQETCQGGQLVDSCAPSTPAANDTTCDGVDDDCSGAADEDYVAGGVCDGPDVGACKTGTLSCSGGDETCTEGGSGDVELCNGLDDDCDTVADNGFANYDGDSFGDECDPDDDNDGLEDPDDACDNSPPDFVSATGPDYDGDGCKDDDIEDADDDNDGVLDGPDACDTSPANFVSDTTSDHDGDGCKDDNPGAEDTDDDNDGVPDAADDCATGRVGFVSNSDPQLGTVTDYDGDGCEDATAEDLDDDEDGREDGDDLCDTSRLDFTSFPEPQSGSDPDHDNDGCEDALEDDDDDNDGLDDVDDECQLSPAGFTVAVGPDYDTDGCKDDDVEDLDDDNDGVDDTDDACDPGSGDQSDLDWISDSGTTTPGTDYDEDGCQDAGEDDDDDNDGRLDPADKCDPDAIVGDPRVRSNRGPALGSFTSTAETDNDLDGCQDGTSEDLDRDNDGVNDNTGLAFCGPGESVDCADNCLEVANAGQEDFDLNGVGDACQDTDGDTVLDHMGAEFCGAAQSSPCKDNCVAVANPTQADFDSNGIGDACQDTDGDTVLDHMGADFCDTGDVTDCKDNCPGLSNAGQLDTDDDGAGDVCDTDDDGDDDLDDQDNCPLIANPDQEDADSDGVGDVCDTCTDKDGDGWGIAGANSGCLGDKAGVTDCDDAIGNTSDLDMDNTCDVDDTCVDADGDGWGFGTEKNVSVCAETGQDCNDTPGNDVDDDMDNVCDDATGNFCTTGQSVGCKDNCAAVSNPGQEDFNSDGQGDVCDNSDGDTFLDAVDNCRLVSNEEQTDTDVNGIGDACQDTDGDTVLDHGGAGFCTTGQTSGCKDNCPTVANVDQTDTDGDGLGDACETDTDDDGVPDTEDNCPDDPNADQLDTDRDGDGDVCDTTCPYGPTPFEICNDCIDNDCNPGTSDTDTTVCAWRRTVTINTKGALGLGYPVSVTFDHEEMVDGGRSTASGDDLHVFWKDPEAACDDTNFDACYDEVHRVRDPLTPWDTQETKVWFPLQAAIAGNATETTYEFFFKGSGSVLADEGQVFHFADFFDRTPAEPTNLGSEWSEVSDAGNNDMTIAANTLEFTTVNDAAGKPWTQATFDSISSGLWEWRFNINFTYGSGSEYLAGFQLVNATVAQDPAGQAALTYPGTGVGPSLAWSDASRFGGNGRLGVQSDSTYTNIGTSAGSQEIVVAIDLDANTYALTALGSTANGLTFGDVTTDTLSGMRFLVQNMAAANASGRRIGYTMLRPTVASPPETSLNANDLLGDTCGLFDTGLAARYFLDEGKTNTGDTTLDDISSGTPIPLTRSGATLGQHFGSYGLFFPTISTSTDYAIATFLRDTDLGNLDNDTAVTGEIVMQNDVSDAASNVTHYLFALERRREDPVSFALRLVGRSTIQACLSQTCESYALDTYLMGRVVIHFVYSGGGADEVQLFINGVKQTPSASVGVSNDLQLGGSGETNAFFLGNSVAGLGGTGTIGAPGNNSLRGKIYYAAIYARSLSQSEVDQNVNVLLRNDDQR